MKKTPGNQSGNIEGVVQHHLKPGFDITGTTKEILSRLAFFTQRGYAVSRIVGRKRSENQDLKPICFDCTAYSSKNQVMIIKDLGVARYLRLGYIGWIGTKEAYRALVALVFADTHMVSAADAPYQ